MRARLEHEGAAAVDRLIDLAHAHRVAVLCVERDHTRCHRTVITDLVRELDPSIDVVQIL